jgi:CDP-glucose 4,6-dehydratase
LCRSYFETYGLPVSVTRCGNLYGGGDLNFNRIVPGTIKSVLNEARPVIRSDGTFCRDYFYVKDAVEAYTMLAEKIGKKGIDGEAFNFSPEHPLTVLALVDKILKAMGSNLEPEIQNKASNEIKDQYLSAKKARSVLDWHPLYTLEEGLSETAIWYREFFRNEGRSWKK